MKKEDFVERNLIFILRDFWEKKSSWQVLLLTEKINIGITRIYRNEYKKLHNKK